MILIDARACNRDVTVFTFNCLFCVIFRYVSLSDNEKTGFKARELKSVQVDAVGNFLKLNIHKNHINKYNLYNQVRSSKMSAEIIFG